MKRFVTLWLPILLAALIAGAVTSAVTDPDTTAASVVFWLAVLPAWFLAVPLAGFLAGLAGFEPRQMRQLFGGGWAKGMRLTGRTGRWHHT